MGGIEALQLASVCVCDMKGECKAAYKCDCIVNSLDCTHVVGTEHMPACISGIDCPEGCSYLAALLTCIGCTLLSLPSLCQDDVNEIIQQQLS